MTQTILAISTFLGLLFGLIGIESADVSSHWTQMPEICDNAIDDDMDGLIDLNDPDCSCNDLVRDYFIPNPSFEDTLCCPVGDVGGSKIPLSGKMDCVVSWDGFQQVGADLFHDCINFQIPSLNRRAPVPVPDGNSVIGFGANGSGSTNISEYISACLNEPFMAGQTYVLDFDIGQSASSKNQFTFAIFGAPDCSEPFQDSLKFGCPANNPAWDIIDSVTVNVGPGWSHAQFSFTPVQDIGMIALGSGCDGDTLGDYYYLDNLVLFDQRDINIINRLRSGSICGGTGIIGIDAIPGSMYQWYKDGIALVGETGNTLTLSGLTSDNGIYMVTVQNDRGCFSSSRLPVSVDPVLTRIDTSFCTGQFLDVGTNRLDSTGFYIDTLLRVNGCDSIIQVDLIVYTEDTTNQSFSICIGDSVAVGQNVYRRTGMYRDVLNNENGCDSIINTAVQVRQLAANVIDTMICEGETYRNGSSIFTESGSYDLTYTSENGCDSALVVNLVVQEPSILAMDVHLCNLDDTVFIGNQIITEPGVYEVPLISSVGCDSTVIIRASLSISPIIIDRIKKVTLGDDVVLDPLLDTGAIDSIHWLPNTLFEDVSEMRQIVRPMENSSVSIMATDTAGCVWEESIELRVMSDLGVFVPNVFTPNQDGLNDFWMIRPGQSTSRINQIMIYDRWGNLVYAHSGFAAVEISETTGWDGMFNGTAVQSGVYVYQAMVQYIDGRELPFSGDLTVLR